MSTATRANQEQSLRVHQQLDSGGGGSRQAESDSREEPKGLNLLAQLWEDAKTFFEMMKDKHYSVPFSLKLKVVACALYVLSPIDLLPEVLLGPIGLLDDFAVIAYFIGTVKDVIKDYRVWRSRRKSIVLSKRDR